MRDRLDNMDLKRRAKIEGFIEGLCYAQAQDPLIDDRPLKIDFPTHLFFNQYEDEEKPMTVQEFVDVWHDFDDEGGILSFRFTAEKNTYSGKQYGPYLKLHLASTEGHRGIPEDWERHDDGRINDPKWLTVEQAQEVLDASRQ